MIVPEDKEGEIRNGYRVSALRDEKVLEICCTTI